MSKIDVTIDRDKYIGGSDIPTIMNINHFKTRHELLLEKAGLTISEFEGNEYTEYGHKIEPLIRQYLNDIDVYNGEFTEQQAIKGNRRYHADGVNTDRVLEIKSTSQIKETVDEYKTYLPQLLEGMEMFEKQYGTLAVYDRPEDFREQLANDEVVFESERLQIFDIEKDDYKLFIDKKNNAVDQFVIDIERIKENPLLTEEDLLPEEIKELSEKVVEDAIITDEVKTRFDENKSKLKSLMEIYGRKSFDKDDNTKITLIEDGNNKVVEEEVFDEEAFIQENKELVEKYEKLTKEIEEVKKKYTTYKSKVVKGRAGYLKITLPKK